MPGFETTPLRVLLVEDNPADADLVRVALEEARARISLDHVERLDEALAHLARRSADAVLLDLNLPDASGTEGLGALRQDFPRIPVIVLTGSSFQEGLDTVKSGAQDYLSKGAFDGRSIERAIRYSIERQRNHARAQELAEERASRRAAEAAAKLLDLSYRVAEAGLTHADTKECLRVIVNEVREGLQTDSATLLLVSEDREALIVQASQGLGEHEGERIPLGQGIAGALALSAGARAIDDLKREDVASPTLHQLSSMMGTPLRIAGRTIGVLHVGSFRPRTFTPDEVRVLDTLGSRVALVVENAQLREQARDEDARLRDADRRKDEFLAVLSHELRNPLAPIHNSLYLLGRTGPGGDQARRALSIIERQVAHMTRLVDDLLDVSRITRGKVQLHKERIDLRRVVGRAVEDLRSVFAARRIDLDAALGGEPIWMNGDATRLAQSVSNLLNNAAKFTHPGGRVAVDVGPEGSVAVVRVRDTGAGIAPDMLRRLFQPFAQADRTLDRSAGGLGLGLALVKGMVELHGGTVEARSAGPDMGAEFILRLPVEPSVGAGDAERGPSRDSTSATRARRVLIIEDNVDAAESLKEALELDHHEVAVAFGGPEGLEAARAFEPDVVLCDVGLPGMNGYDVARKLRGDPSSSSTYLVALTGYAQPEDRRRAHDAGFDLHLSKPLDFRVIERLLASSIPG